VNEGRDSKPSEQPVTSGKLERCAVHGLHFDSSQSIGCVLCRRSSTPPVRPVQRRQAWIWISTGGLVLAVAGTAIALGLSHRAGSRTEAAPETIASGPLVVARSRAPRDQARGDGPKPGVQADDAEREDVGDAAPARDGSPDAALKAKAFEEACAKGDAVSCQRLSELLSEGRGLPRDPARALALRDRGMAAAMGALGQCKDPKCELVRLTYEAGGETIEQFRRAEIAPDIVARECDAGKLVACEGLRAAYASQSSKLAKDPTKVSEFGAKANQLLDRQCQAGDRAACKTLTSHLLHVQPTDVPRGRRLADAACAKGDYSECWMLGEFLTGPGAERDIGAANSYFGRAIPIATTRCEAGDASACQLLAQAYRLGQGVVADEKKFAEYTLKVVGGSLKR
jgi:TPR repeat protein